jgi:hypothetical protein
MRQVYGHKSIKVDIRPRLSDTVCPKRPSEGWFAVSSRRFRLLNPCGHAIVGRITEFSVAEPKNNSYHLMGELRTAARYEAFIREGAKVNYRAEWHPGDGAPFLGPERFVKKIAKEPVPPTISRRASLRDLLKNVAVKSGVPAEILLRKGRLANVINARDQFIREGVLEQGYLAAQVADFLSCHLSNVSRALQKS